MCLVDSIDLDVMYISVEALCRLTACDALVRLPCLVDVAPGGVVDVLSGLSSYVQSSIDVDRTRWSGPGCGWCQLSDSPAASRRNRVTIQLLDSIGDSVSGMEEGDVVVYVIDKESGTAIGGSSTTVTILEDDAFEVQFLIPADSSVKRVGLNAVVSQIYTSHLALKVGRPVEGVSVGTLTIRTVRSNLGMAINQSQTLMAVSSWQTYNISLYSLPSGDFLRSFGDQGPDAGYFSDPLRLCFTPKDTILVTEDDNKRVQEVDVFGRHVRFIGRGLFQCGVRGMDINANLDLLVVGNHGSSTHQLHLFQLESGTHIRSFGPHGSLEGQLDGCFGIRFTPDETGVVVSEFENKRISFFSLAGEYVRCIELRFQSWDVAFSLNGELIVADESESTITFLSPDGLSRRALSMGWKKSHSSSTLIVHPLDGRLYSLDRNSPTVHIFE